jgi:hypothetical protein
MHLSGWERHEETSSPILSWTALGIIFNRKDGVFGWEWLQNRWDQATESHNTSGERRCKMQECHVGKWKRWKRRAVKSTFITDGKYMRPISSPPLIAWLDTSLLSWLMLFLWTLFFVKFDDMNPSRRLRRSVTSKLSLNYSRILFRNFHIKGC